MYGEDFAFLLDPNLYKDRFIFIQDNLAGTLPIKEQLPTAVKAAVSGETPVVAAQETVASTDAQ